MRVRHGSTTNSCFVPAALVLAWLVCGGAGLAAQEADHHELRTVSVTGEGSVTATPDLARLRVGVLSEAQTARAASEENAKKMSQVVDTLRKAGVSSEKIRTIQLTVEAVYDYPEPRNRPVLRGFQARNVVEAETGDLAKLGEMLDAVVAAGGNTIEGVEFDLEDKGAAQAHAMTDALTDARRKAGALARAAGVELGDVQQISAGYGGGPIPLPSQPRFAVMEGRAEAAPPPVSPGQLTITATVQVAYRLK
jgi:hypothetical protein